MDIDLLKYPLGVTVLLKKTARVHDTITRESDGLMPLSPWPWTCLRFILTTIGKSSYSYHIHETEREYSHNRRYPVELMIKHETSRPKGATGKVDVLDELQIISCKILTTVGRYGRL
jgi:hypothetical protein